MRTLLQDIVSSSHSRTVKALTRFPETLVALARYVRRGNVIPWGELLTKPTIIRPSCSISATASSIHMPSSSNAAGSTLTSKQLSSLRLGFTRTY